MKMFSDLGISKVPHFAPLHYLPFIARSGTLLSKVKLAESGFTESHFRARSARTDVKRGFRNYAFLTLSQDPKIVQAKLKGGFPHISIQVPISTFETTDFDLCRYNVAMTRRTVDSPTGGFPESSSNGRYYDGMKLPIARELDDKQKMLKKYYPKGIMIEVLVRDLLHLPDNTEIDCYCHEDFILAEKITAKCNSPWRIQQVVPPGTYNRKDGYVNDVEKFIDLALTEHDWKGNGLDFDRV